MRSSMVRWSLAAALAAALLLAGGPVQAANLTWDANTGTAGAQDGAGTWDTANTNWWTGSANTSWNSATPDWAVFGAGGAGPYTVTLGEPVTVGRLTFNAGPTYTLSGSALNLGTYATTYVYVNGVGQDARIDSAIAGAKIYKYGTGRLILAGNNTFGTGSLDVNGGVLNIRHNNAVGNSHYVHVTGSNRALEIQDGITVSNGLYIRGTGIGGTGSLLNVSGDNTWAGFLRLHGSGPDASIGVNPGSTLTVSGGIEHYSSTRNLTKVGDGTLIISGNGTYQGTTSIDAGVVNIRHNNALGTTAGGTTVASGAVLQMENNITVGAEALTLNGTGVGGTGALRSVGGTNVWNGNIVENSARIGVDTGSTLTINGQISGSGTFTKTGGGKLILTGDNNYAATTDLLAGVLNIQHDNALGTINYCHVVSTSAALELEGGITVSNSGVYIKGAGAGGAGSLRSVSGDNTWANYVRMHWDNPNASIGVDAGSTLTITGQVEPVGGSNGALHKVGDGTLILTNSNTYHWPTYVDDGVLSIRNAGALGTTAGGTSVAYGATLSMQGDLSVAGEALTLDGFGHSGSDALRSVSGDNAWTGAVTLAGPSYVRVDADTLTLSGQIGGSRLYKYGTGKLILSGANTFGAGGAMDVRDGVLNLRHDNALGASGYCHVISGKTLEVQDDITVSNGLYIGNASSGDATLNLHSLSGDNTWNGFVRIHAGHPHAIVGVEPGTSLTINGVIDDYNGTAGTLTKVGAGTLTLNGSNSFRTPTSVNEGVLNVGHANALGTAEAGTTVASGAALNIQGGLTVANEALTLNGHGVGNTGALRSLSGVNSWDGPVTLNGICSVGVDADTLTLSGQVGGSGGLYKRGGGTLILTGANSYGGWTDVFGGVINARHDNALGNSSVHVYNEATLELENDISVARGLYIGNSSSTSTTVNLHNVSGDNTWNGFVRIHAGHPYAIVGVEPGTSLTINGVIDDYNGTSGSLTKVGAGTLTLNGSNSFRTATSVNEGVLNVGHANALGTAEAGTTVASGAALNIQGGLTVANEALTLNGNGVGNTGALRSLSGDNAWNGPIHVATGSYVGVDADTLTLPGPISGSNLYKVGNGTLILTGANSFGGGGAMDVIRGTLDLRHNNGLGTSVYAHVFPAGTLELRGGLTVPNGLYLGNANQADTAVGLRSVSGDNTWAGFVRPHGGWHAHARIAVDSGSTLTITGPIETYGSTPGTLTKVGAGPLTLTNASTYTGGTYVEEGALLVNNTSGSGTGTGAVTVNGGILGGTGAISGAVTVTAGAHAAPGASTTAFSPGSLGTGALTLNSSAEFDVELLGALAGAQYDLLDVIGGVALEDSILNLALGYAPDDGQKFTIIANDGTDAVSGTFRGLPESGRIDASFGGTDYGFWISYQGDTGNDVVLSAVPEPATMALLALGVLGLVARRRRR